MWTIDKKPMQICSRFSNYTTETIAGSCNKGLSDGVLLTASFNGPCALEQLANGVVMVSDSLNNCLRLVDLDSGHVSTLDASGTSGFQMSILAPRGLCKIVINGVNGILLSDSGHNRLVFINGETGHCDHLAGTGEAAHLDGGFSQAAFNSPHSVVSDPVNGIIYLTDTKNHCIRTLSLATRKVRTLAGTPGVFGYRDGLNPLFNEPLGLVLTEDSNIIVCDSKNGALRHISRENGETITLVGRPNSAVFATRCTYSYRNSIANQRYLSQRRTGVGNYASFRFELPYSLAFVDDVLLISDAGSGRLYALDSHFEAVHCLNDQASGRGYLDGPLKAAMFKAPAGLSKCGPNILVTDTETNCIRSLFPTSVKTHQSFTSGPHNMQGKENEELTSVNESLLAVQSLTNAAHGSVGLQSKAITSGPTSRLSRVAEGSSCDLSDALVALVEPSTLQYTMDRHLVDEDLSTKDGAHTPSYVKGFLDDPYPVSGFNLELFDILIRYFLSASTPSPPDRPPYKPADKPTPARVASNLAVSTRSAPTRTSSNSRTPRDSTINISLHGGEYTMRTVIEVCTILSSRIFDMSSQTYSVYGKKLAKYLTSFNPLLFLSKVSMDGKEQTLLEHNKKGLLKGLAMATNAPVFTCNLLSEDGLRAEYLVITGRRGVRVFVVEPKTASFVMDLTVGFLVDSLFIKCFNTAEILFHHYSSKKSEADVEDVDAQKTTYLDDLLPEKGDKGATASNTRPRVSRLKAIKANLANESSMNVSSTMTVSDGEDNCPDAESFESDSTMFTAFDVIKPQEKLTEMVNLSIDTTTFLSATCGLFDYSPHHSIGECSIKIPVSTGASGEERSVFVVPVSQALFSKRYGVAPGDSFCYEVVIYFSIIGHQVTERHAAKITADKIKLCDYAELRIPYMIARSLAAFKSFTAKAAEAQEASSLPPDVGRLERNIILGVGATTAGSACVGKPLRDKILEPLD